MTHALPKITVALFTYSPAIDHARHRYACGTLASLLLNLHYEGQLAWHIADDGSPAEHRQQLRQAVLHAGAVATSSDSERAGYGASYNAMTAVVHRDDAEMVLCVEDDWLLSRPLDLTPLARVLQLPDLDPVLDNGSENFTGMAIRCIRLGYLGWTKPLRGELVRPLPGQTFLMLDPATPEHHVFSAGPRLETVGFQRRLGLWLEHCYAGVAEVDAASRPQSRRGVAWPLDQGINAALDNPSVFVHIGSVSIKDEAPS
jgi:hypothetical protein